MTNRDAGMKIQVSVKERQYWPGVLPAAQPYPYVREDHMVSFLAGTVFIAAAGAVVWQMLNTREET